MHTCSLEFQAKAEEAERKDLEIQFLSPSQQQLEKWRKNQEARGERKAAREARAEER
jgi:hypothetical protein